MSFGAKINRRSSLVFGEIWWGLFYVTSILKNAATYFLVRFYFGGNMVAR